MELVVRKETSVPLRGKALLSAPGAQRRTYQNDLKPQCDPQLSRTILVPSSITQKWREMALEGPFKAKGTIVSP